MFAVYLLMLFFSKHSLTATIYHITVKKSNEIFFFSYNILKKNTKQ